MGSTMALCGSIIVLLLLTTTAWAGSSFEDKIKRIEKLFSEGVQTGLCGGKEMDQSKIPKIVKKFQEKSAKSSNKLIDLTSTGMVSFGSLEGPLKPFDEEQKLVDSMLKDGLYDKKAMKKFAREVFSEKCNKKFDKKDDKQTEEGVVCILEAFNKACWPNLVKV